MQIEHLKQLIDYNPDTGALTWRYRDRWVTEQKMQTDLARRKFNDRMVGKPCLTTPDKDGYFAGHVLGNFYRAHRVAFALHHGKWPKETIDHINRVRTDNRSANLREATRSEQQSNRNKQKNNKSGAPGVHKDGKTGLWVARATIDKKRVLIGRFAKKSQAITAKQSYAGAI